MTVLHLERLWSRRCCISQRLSGGNSHNLFISPLVAARDADCLLSLMYCRQDPHRGQEALIATSRQPSVRSHVVFIPPSSKEGSLSDEKKKKSTQSTREALTANSSQKHTYQAGADSSKGLMGSSGVY